MNQKIFRHELKYFINYFEYESLRRRLSSVLKRDKFANENGDYHIRSLYFDDIRNTALYEKQAGMLNRKKYRIRIYNIDDNIIKLEKKFRTGQFIHKESAFLNKKEYNKIINQDIDFLKNSENRVLQEFYFDMVAHRYRAKVIVDYIREAYILNVNNIRITFDKSLKTALEKIDIFDKSLPTVDVIDEPKIILEIKYNHFLPNYIRNILQIKTSQRWAISKYVMCRKFGKQNSWEDN
ncbi:hypothetical protein MNB_SV-15-1091 [hydrothermal vent metagenome]|uniref:VTC domain-containing protein n=1 Tax=hydrothermal vent metagenome TaxID=652676 RepID=A0A1W1EKW8_9ZZZZ